MEKEILSADFAAFFDSLNQYFVKSNFADLNEAIQNAKLEPTLEVIKIDSIDTMAGYLLFSFIRADTVGCEWKGSVQDLNKWLNTFVQKLGTWMNNENTALAAIEYGELMNYEILSKEAAAALKNRITKMLAQAKVKLTETALKQHEKQGEKGKEETGKKPLEEIKKEEAKDKKDTKVATPYNALIPLEKLHVSQEKRTELLALTKTEIVNLSDATNALGTFIKGIWDSDFSEIMRETNYAPYNPIELLNYHRSKIFTIDALVLGMYFTKVSYNIKKIPDDITVVGVKLTDVIKTLGIKQRVLISERKTILTPSRLVALQSPIILTIHWKYREEMQKKLPTSDYQTLMPTWLCQPGYSTVSMSSELDTEYKKYMKALNRVTSTLRTEEKGNLKPLTAEQADSSFERFWGLSVQNRYKLSDMKLEVLEAMNKELENIDKSWKLL
jgi:hypothetical protein